MGQKASSTQFNLKKHEVREFMQITHCKFCNEIDQIARGVEP